MATLDPKALATIRRAVTKGEQPDFKKKVLNDSLQGIEDWFVSQKAEIASLLPPVGATMKKRILAHYFEFKFNQEK
tara:strand:- start:1762 stop:1989 length:228 start_codon:yes stop_codon:yes gene_type:complete